MPVPEPCFLWRGTGEALNEIATGYEGAWPEIQGAVRPAAHESGGANARSDVDLATITIKGASIYDVPDGGVPSTSPPAVAVAKAYAGRAGDSFICTSAGRAHRS